MDEMIQAKIDIVTTVLKHYENKSFCQKTLVMMEEEPDLEKKLAIGIKALEHYENRAKCKVALEQIKSFN